jgi:tRNA pseudouridine13 synthase
VSAPSAAPADHLLDLLDLPTAHGKPPARGLLRATPEDFRVEEVLGFEPDGAGPHVLLTVEKRGANTGWVAAQLARAAGIAVRDVGWSGQKDRDAVTRQAFTIPWPERESLDACHEFRGEGFRVVGAVRHGRKLRPGSHRSNRFEVRVAGLQGDITALDARLRLVERRGVPNYFGPQRFGRSGSNLSRARGWAASGTAPRDRTTRGFALSAARSMLFNAVLAERVGDGCWDRLLPGEAAMLDGRRSFFRATDIDSTLIERCEAMDVHPSGPLWGRGESPASDAALEVENRVASRERELCSLLSAEGLDHERRSLRLPVRGLRWSADEGCLLLGFELPRGTFATAVLHEIVADAWAEDSGIGA